MITSLPRLICFAIAALIMSSPNVKGEERITCPSIEKAAELVKMKATHFGGDDWEIETKGENVFYVALDYDLCIFRFVANLSHFIPSLNDAGDEWGSISKIGTLIESDGDVFLKHHVLLPFGSDILPPASFTSNTPEQISHKFKSLSQKPSILPEDT